MSYPAKLPADRFWVKVKKTKGCWLWLGKTTSWNGYGAFWLGGGRTGLAHRFSYELLVGEIPPKLQVDHLCRNRSCVNPKHMELVSIKENVLRGMGLSAINLRKTHCIRGHPFEGKNLRVYKKTRVCRNCKSIRQVKYQNKNENSKI